MSNYQRPIRLLFILVVFLTSPASGLASPEQTKSRIGVIAPLSGAIATWGKSVRAAIELANKDSKNPAELFFEDEESCQSTKTLSAFNSLVLSKNVDVIVASCLEGGQVIAPMAERREIPFFISGRSSRDFQRAHPNALSWLSLLDYEGQAIASLIRKRGWTRGAAMVWSGYFGIQFSEGIKVAVREAGVPFEMSIHEHGQGSTPVGAEVLALLRKDPQVVFLMLTEPDAAFVIKQLRALRYRGEIVLQSSMLQSYDRNARASFSGALQQKFPGDDLWITRLRQDLHGLERHEVADDFVFSYDGFTLLLRALTECRGSSKETLNICVTRILRDESWHEGASGRFRFMKDGSTERPMIFKVITQDGFQDIPEFLGAKKER